MSTVSAINIDTASTDVNKLGAIGRYQLRRLAEELTKKGIPLVDTDEKKMSFMSLPTPMAMAEAVAAGLKVYRERGGVEAAPQPTAIETLSEGATVATAAPAPVTPQEKPKRQPKTAADIAKAASVPAPTTTTSEVEELCSSLTKGFDELKDVVKEQQELIRRAGLTIVHMKSQHEELSRKLDVALGMLGAIGENVLGGTIKNVFTSGCEIAEDINLLIPKGEGVAEEE